MMRFVAPLALVGLLAACNTGDSFLEWDEETAAMLAAQEAEAEAAAAGTSAEMAGEGAAASEGVAAASDLPLTLLAADGTIRTGNLRPDAKSTQVTVFWSDGDSCSGGLVEQAPGSGTFALTCAGGDIWLGDYVESAPGAGAWTMRNASGAQARALYGPDAAVAGPDAFEALWQSRGAAG